ncbi:MAG: hypothetical protein AAGB19_17230 [Cyanobacteria bacterium P01_F01_bin.3]
MTAKRSLSTHLLRLLLPVVIILVGIGLTLWMLSFSRSGVLFSGDGGLKALIAQQLAQQLQTASFPLDVSLNLPAADWVKTVWQEGLYPFSPPFVYSVGAQNFITFPFTFPLVSAPFYALFGDRGLYVVPLIALWLTWLRFWQIGTRAGWGVMSLCLGLMILIFASPLSLYGGMYWEHTLAVALAFWGVSGLVFPKERVLSNGMISVTRAQALGSGILIGLSVWFRPEFLCLLVAVSLLALMGWAMPKWRLAPAFTLTKACILIGSMACTVGVFFALNYGVYGHPLGIHAIQIVEESSVSSQVSQARASYWQLLTSLQRYFPVVWVVGLAALFSPELQKSAVKANLSKRNRSTDDKGTYFEKVGIRKTVASNLVPSRFAIALSLLFALSVPLIVPPGAGGKQWGPRFYLILVPLLSLALSEQLRANFFRRTGRRLIMLGTVVALIFGINLNTLNGAFTIYKDGANTSLMANYEPIVPAIEKLDAETLPWISMSHEFVAQQLWSALPDKLFFRGETAEQVKQLATALVEQDESEFLYVCYPHRECPVPETEESEWALENGARLNMTYIEDYGKYPVYRVEIAS